MGLSDDKKSRYSPAIVRKTRLVFRRIQDSSKKVSRISLCTIAMGIIIVTHFLFVKFSIPSRPNSIYSSRWNHPLVKSKHIKKKDGILPSDDDVDNASDSISAAAHDEMTQVHVVFSTGCTKPSTEVSSFVIQNSALLVNHTGPITRIVSGCNKEKEEKIRNQVNLYPDFHLYFTPIFFPHPIPEINDRYPPYNKPFGVRHWLHHHNATNNSISEKIIVLIDADFVFLKPITVNSHSKIRYKGNRYYSEVDDTVEPGRGMAQDWYNYMRAGLWSIKPHVQKIICQGQPCEQVSKEDAMEYYSPTGPPYIFHIDDMYRFVEDYCNFTIQVRKYHKRWMSEMHGMALALANNDIRLTVLTDLGITHPRFAKQNGREYWEFIDKVQDNPCNDTKGTLVTDSSLHFDDLPVALHLCQRYSNFTVNGTTYEYSKKNQPFNLMDCEAPMLEMPPAVMWEMANSVKQEERRRKRGEVWTHCTVTRYVNTALEKFKLASCPANNRTINLRHEQKILHIPKK